MQSQDVSAAFLIKFWPWLEANRNRLIGIAVAAGVILLGWYYVSTQRAQKAVDAGQAYTALQLNLPPNSTAQQVAAGFLQVAGKYSGTLAGQRAQLQAASLLFDAGRYADAQAMFQKFLNANHDSPLAAEARLGVAASLEAQNQPGRAETEYRAVTTSYPDSPEMLPAEFALARVLEAQGKLSEAAGCYQQVLSAPLAGSLVSEAAQRLQQIRSKLPAAKLPEVKPAMKF
jgi:predicted negative regulator of RcsB-dependent stress response